MAKQVICEPEIRKAIGILKPNNALFEVRAINGRQNYSGYFNDADMLIQALSRDIRDFCGFNFYITLNIPHDACYGRSQRDRFVKMPDATTSDNDIIGYDWMLVDVDPVRPKGTSSTDEQIEISKKKGNEIYQFMKKLGFSEPVLGLSGNGVHLLYRVALRNNDKNKMLLKKCLETLDMLFSDDEVKIDTVNHNQSRICKLYGTLAQKGSDSKKYPHRLSRIIRSPKEPKMTDKSYLVKLSEMLPKEEKPQKYNNYSPSEFDVESWMSQHGLRYRRTSYSDGTKYVLDCCPFDSNHKNKDACVFKSRNGALGFHCFHNSCSNKTWRDVRLMFEPDAYEKKWQEQEKRQYGTFNRDKKPSPKPIVAEEGKPVFLTAMDIANMPQGEETFIRTGTEIIDKKMRGLKKGYVSLLSGVRASAKSTWLSQIVLSAIETGNNVGVFSGELSAKNFMQWMQLQAAGKNRVEPGKYEGYFSVPLKYRKEINEWMQDRLFLYNNDYGNNFVNLIKEFEKIVDEKKLDMIVLDNLMALNIKDLSDSKYDAQTEFIWKLHQLAQEKQIHILFVAHPRKSLGFLRLDDISGSADLANAVDNAFIIHRNNEDFRRLTKMTFQWNESNPIYDGTNIIEISKDRDGGNQDAFIPLYYEAESKRLKNNKAENIIYSWDKDSDGFSKIDMEIIPFD